MKTTSYLVPRTLYLVLMLNLFVATHVVGQTPLTASQQQQVMEKIDCAARSMSSMQCDFIQTKRMKLLRGEMESRGVMYFKKPDCLRWQYTAPYDYSFILNGDKVSLVSAKSKQKIDVQRNKILRQITTIILGCITAGGLNSPSDFRVELYKTPTAYSAKLYPKKKELKQIYDVIEITFNDALSMVSRVVMTEKSGDVTTVKLLNVKTNPTIDDRTFHID